MVGSVAEKNDEGRDLSIALSYYDPTEWEKAKSQALDLDDMGACLPAKVVIRSMESPNMSSLVSPSLRLRPIGRDRKSVV